MSLEFDDKDINQDVVFEILVRLPPFSVVRFKLVSKKWYAFISDPYFCLRHSLQYHHYIQETERIDHLSDGLWFGRFWNGGGIFSCAKYFPEDWGEPQPDYLIFPPPSSSSSNHDQIQNPPPPPILQMFKEEDNPLALFMKMTPQLSISSSNDDDHPLAKFGFFTLASFCNGLVIFRSHDIREYAYCDFDGSLFGIDTRMHIKHSILSTYFLCNPILKQYIELPRINPLLLVPPIQNEKIVLIRTYRDDNEYEKDVVPYLEPVYEYEPIILFDPAISLSYKVIWFLVRRQTLHSDNLLQIYVYSQPPPSEITPTASSSSSSWRFITSFPWDRDNNLASKKSVLLNGVLYSLSSEFIICFDVVKESVWFLRCPLSPTPSGMIYQTYRYFGEIGGHLQLVVEHSSVKEEEEEEEEEVLWFTFPCSFDVLEMEEQHHHHYHHHHHHNQEVSIHPTVWTLKYRVNNIQPPPWYDQIILGDLRTCDIHIMRLYKTGRKGEDGKEEEALLLKILLLHAQKDMMFIFNLTSNTFSELLNVPFVYYHESYEDVFPYTMTMFPLSSSRS